MLCLRTIYASFHNRNIQIALTSVTFLCVSSVLLYLKNWGISMISISSLFLMGVRQVLVWSLRGKNKSEKTVLCVRNTVVSPYTFNVCLEMTYTWRLVHHGSISIKGPSYASTYLPHQRRCPHKAVLQRTDYIFCSSFCILTLKFWEVTKICCKNLLCWLVDSLTCMSNIVNIDVLVKL